MSTRTAEIRFEVIHVEEYGWLLRDRRAVPRYLTGNAYNTLGVLFDRSVRAIMNTQTRLPEEFFVPLNKEELLPLKV